MNVFGNKLLVLLLLLTAPAWSEELDLASFKDADMLWLGSASGLLAPLAEELVLAEAGSGEIEFYKKDGEQVKAREIWALMDRERLEQQEKDFVLAEKELGYQLSDLDGKYKGETKKLEGVVKKIEEQIRELVLSKKLPEVSKLGKEIDEAVASFKKEIADAHHQHAMSYSAEKLDFEKEKLRQSLNKRRTELRLFRDEKQYQASVSGRLEYLLPEVRFLEGSDTKAKVKAGDQIALIRDDSKMLVVIPQTSFPLALLKNKRYLARVTTESGTSFTAHYYDKVTRQESGKLLSYHRFQVRDVDLASARPGSGQKVIANISETFGQRVYIVTKADLLHHDAHLVEEKGWIKAALTLWPGCKVLSEGGGALAIEKNDEN